MLTPNMSVKVARPGAPPEGDWDVTSDSQTIEGHVYHLRGHAKVEGATMTLRADEIDYDDDTKQAEARGNVLYENYVRNEKLLCDKVEYNIEEETGKFYKVRGYAKVHIDARPGVLTSSEPFYFEGEWAERIHDKYILHDGMITSCKMPDPWWTLRGPEFDIVPDEHAIAHRAIFRLRKVPLFYTPFFYKSLEKVPRRSGFLTPNVGNSTRRGQRIGLGYFWAINRSYDVTYRFQDFTERGVAQHVDFRGKPTQTSDFNFILYDVTDRGLKQKDGSVLKASGYSINTTGRAELGDGFTARANINYLSSLKFRQEFTESFNEAIFSESHSTGYITKHFSSFTLNAILARLENFQDATPGNSVLIRKLPEVEFESRDRQISPTLPAWISFESSLGLLSRSQLLFQTSYFSERANFEPRITTALRWGGFHLIPSFTLHETQYSQSLEQGKVVSGSILRSAREVSIDLITPSIERVFNRKTWLGEKLKHVIEPRARFRYVNGVTDFDRLIRFDETELLSDTTEAEVSVTNRLYAKRNGVVREVLTWELWQRRFFDPEFGGALTPGQRNVVLSTADLTGYTFLDRPRNYSPIVSVLRATPRDGVGLEWRTDYDPLRGGIVNSGFTLDGRMSKYFASIGHNQVRSETANSPAANQVRGVVGFGNSTQRGWNAAFTAIYDYRASIMQFATTQVTYNTDCCGFSVQYRRFDFTTPLGTRNESQFRLAFTVANVGSFGTLKKQERLF